MPNFTEAPPLSLYIHLPWCVRKCPYCDFNSHQAPITLPEDLYVEALRQELESHLAYVQDRQLTSIFFGGGTPSLFSATAIKKILEAVSAHITFSKNIEITLEANPGTVDEARFHGFYAAGVNRLSLGIQSLQDDKLQQLGRIHHREHALGAIQSLKQAGFNNFNLDIMYGLPNQTIEDALSDIQIALAHSPTHFSWYQLTIEPNTLFHYQKPTLPSDDLIWEMQIAGQALIKKFEFTQYEVSAYAKSKLFSKHNLNYWEFGDYLGIGAGAHSKITMLNENKIMRHAQVKNPRDYLLSEKRQSQVWKHVSTESDLIFEFMLNALRLTEGFSKKLFEDRTGLGFTLIEPILEKACEKKLIIFDGEKVYPTELGKKFLNDLVEMFLVIGSRDQVA